MTAQFEEEIPGVMPPVSQRVVTTRVISRRLAPLPTPRAELIALSEADAFEEAAAIVMKASDRFTGTDESSARVVQAFAVTVAAALRIRANLWRTKG